MQRPPAPLTILEHSKTRESRNVSDATGTLSHLLSLGRVRPHLRNVVVSHGGLAFGNSVWASSLVLASFMGGLALGSLVVARHGGRWVRPLRVYAILELVIGATGLGLVLLLPSLASWLAPLFRPFLEQPWVLNPMRLAIAFALLLVPATAMGATLPLLVRTLSRYDENFGRVLGRLYGWNTLGAVAGALSAELVLIGAFGVRGTGVVAAVLNVAAAFLVILLAR